MPSSDLVSSAGAWVLETTHRALLTVTGGRFPKTLMGMQTLELHVVGRTSGERRTTLLTAPIYGEDRVVLIASKGGHSDHPQWYKNLAANPSVEITVDDRTTPMVATTVTGPERAELWAQAVQAYKGYAQYQASTDREIPVVVCTPI